MGNNLKPGCIVLFCLLLNACAAGQIARESSVQDISEIEKLAVGYDQNANWSESEQYYSELTGREPADALHWFRLGNIYARTNRPGAAIRAYQEALQQDSAFSRAWYNLGIIQLQLAAHSFNEMQFHVDPADPFYHRSQKLLGEILNLLGEKEAE